MTPTQLFLSYGRADREVALALERGLVARRQPVWRDERSIAGGVPWADEIERGIRRSRALVVLVSPRSARSQWVAYEYAFAAGARVPAIAVTLGDVALPKPLNRYQRVIWGSKRETARAILDGVRSQADLNRADRGEAPTIFAAFKEDHGELIEVGREAPYSLEMTLWVEGAPTQTREVAFEIPDVSFRDRLWTVSRGRTGAIHEFFTDDMNSYGDVALWAKGIGPGQGSWSVRTTLYDALQRNYAGMPLSPEVRRGLEQIRKH